MWLWLGPSGLWVVWLADVTVMLWDWFNSKSTRHQYFNPPISREAVCGSSSCSAPWSINVGSHAGKPPAGERRPALENSVAAATVTSPDALPKNIHLGNRLDPHQIIPRKLFGSFADICLPLFLKPLQTCFPFWFSLFFPMCKPKPFSLYPDDLCYRCLECKCTGPQDNLNFLILTQNFHREMWNFPRPNCKRSICFLWKFFRTSQLSLLCPLATFTALRQVT